LYSNRKTLPPELVLVSSLPTASLFKSFNIIYELGWILRNTNTWVDEVWNWRDSMKGKMLVFSDPSLVGESTGSNS